MQKCIAMALFLYRKEIATLLKTIFDIEKYKDNYVMHCKTEAEAKSFCRYLDSVGRKWCDGANYLCENEWSVHKDQTCYFFNRGELSDKSYYIKNGYTILEWSDYVASDICFPEVRNLEIKTENIRKMVDLRFPLDNKYVLNFLYDFVFYLKSIAELKDPEGEYEICSDFAETSRNIKRILVSIDKNEEKNICDADDFFEMIKIIEDMKKKMV